MVSIERMRRPLPTLIRACYAMSGTDLRYAPTRLRRPCFCDGFVPPWYCPRGMLLRPAYAISGTDLA
eukprot:3124154-Rhodomonas_salina.2